MKATIASLICSYSSRTPSWPSADWTAKCSPFGRRSLKALISLAVYNTSDSIPMCI